MAAASALATAASAPTTGAAFQTLLGLSTNHQPVTYRQIIDEAA